MIGLQAAHAVTSAQRLNLQHSAQKPNLVGLCCARLISEGLVRRGEYGRVVHRRLRIRRSRYVLTSRRLITTWRALGGGKPVVVQASLDALLPPVLRGTSVITGLASAGGPSARFQGWKALPWPAATVTPPVFIGLANAQAVAGLIAAAQLATRAPVHK
jgi:hypothetical protein